MQAKPRAMWVIITLACLLLSCAVVSLVRPRNRPIPADSLAFPSVRLMRKLAMRDARIVGLSRHGERFCMFRRSGALEVLHLDGRPAYSTRLENVDSAVLSADGDYLMAFSERDPASETLTIVDSKGESCWQMDTAGAVWCADACEADKGASFAVGTGEGYLYVIDIGAKSRHYRRWRAPGAVVSLCASPDGLLTYGTWQDSAVCRSTVFGKTVWREIADPAEMQQVSALAGSARALVCATPASCGRDGEFRLMDRTGRTVLRRDLEADRDERVISAPGGRYVCIAGKRLITHKGKSMAEKHAVLLDELGNKLWEKGSPFFQAEPVAVTDHGFVLLFDGKDALFAVSPKGEMRRCWKVPAAIVQSVASRDGSRLLMKCRDGMLYVLQVSS